MLTWFSSSNSGMLCMLLRPTDLLLHPTDLAEDSRRATTINLPFSGCPRTSHQPTYKLGLCLVQRLLFGTTRPRTSHQPTYKLGLCLVPKTAFWNKCHSSKHEKQNRGSGRVMFAVEFSLVDHFIRARSCWSHTRQYTAINLPLCPGKKKIEVYISSTSRYVFRHIPPRPRGRRLVRIFLLPL